MSEFCLNIGTLLGIVSHPKVKELIRQQTRFDPQVLEEQLLELSAICYKVHELKNIDIEHIARNNDERS